MAPDKRVNGDDLLFRFFQELLAGDSDIAKQMPHLLVATMGIWWPIEVYQAFPVILPHVVRDPTCRGKKVKGVVVEPDAWASPNAKGYVRDDNSLVKNLVKSLYVTGPKASHINGKRLGNAFVAAHVWRKVHHRKLASRVPLLNTFVPNLVWLPRQVAKLSDVEGGPVQEALKTSSYALYREAIVEPALAPVASSAWDLVPEPTGVFDDRFLEDLNWFEVKRSFIDSKRANIAKVVEALYQLEAGRPLTSKVVASRYTDGLPLVGAPARRQLLAALTPFL